MSKTGLREIVFQGLSDALAGGYDMTEHTPDELAGDMIAYDYATEMYFQGREDLEAMRDEMVPFIIEWRKQYG